MDHEYAVYSGSDHLATVKAESDFAAARKVARRLGHRSLPTRIGSLAGAQRFRFIPRFRENLCLTVVEVES